MASCMKMIGSVTLTRQYKVICNIITLHLTANLGSTFGHASVTRLRDDLVASSEATVSPVGVSSRRVYRQQEDGSGNHVYRKNKNLLLEAIRDVRHQMGKGVYEPGNMLYQIQT